MKLLLAAFVVFTSLICTAAFGQEPKTKTIRALLIDQGAFIPLQGESPAKAGNTIPRIEKLSAAV